MKTAGRIIGIILITLIGVLTVLALGINTNTGKHVVSRYASQALEREVTLNGEMIFLPLWPMRLQVNDMTVANYEGGKAEYMAKVGYGDIRVSSLSLLKGRPEFKSITLRNSEINLERNAKGAANWALRADTEESDRPLEMPLIGALNLDDVTISYLDVPERVDVKVAAVTEKDVVNITGKGSYQGKAFNLKAQTGTFMDALRMTPYPVDINLSVGNTTLQAEGTVNDPVHLAGMDVTLRIKGADAAELFPLFGIALPPTAPYDLAGSLSFADSVWKFNNFKGRMGDSDLRGNLAWDTGGERPKLTAVFVSDRLSFKDLGPLIGMAPERAVSAEQKSKAAWQEASPYVIPDVPLDISRLAAMDADVEFTGKRVISPTLPLDDFYMKILLDNLIMKIDPVRFGTASGDIKASLRIDAQQRPLKTDGEFHFRRLSLARLMEGIGEKLGEDQVADGYIGGTASLTGYGKSLREMLGSSRGAIGIGMEGGMLSNLLVELIGLDVAQALGFLLSGDKPTTIRCIVADFGVERGLMETRTFVVDTNDTNVSATGTVNLNGETLDLRLEPQPKDATLVTLRSPILVKGTIKQPRVTVEGGNLIARGGAAAALAILTPIASLLAFVEPGLGEDSNCAALLRDMNKHNKNTSATDAVPKNPTSSSKE